MWDRTNDIQIKTWEGTKRRESKAGTVAEIENTRRRTIASGTTFHWIEAVLFQEYYQKQPGLLKEHEWKAFVTALRKPLPATFRINGTCTNKEQIKNRLQTEYSFELGDVKVDNHMIAPPRPLAWYPNKGLAIRLRPKAHGGNRKL